MSNNVNRNKIDINVKDIIYIFVMLASLIGSYYTLKANVKQLEHKVVALEKEVEVYEADLKEKADKAYVNYLVSNIREVIDDKLNAQNEIIKTKLESVERTLEYKITNNGG